MVLNKKAGIYVHIPFCEHKCIYCDFYSITTAKDKAEYIAALGTEAAFYGAAYGAGLAVDSVFFGGGTPSFLDAPEIGIILRSLRSSFSIAPDAEITMEANPGTVDGRKLEELRGAGVNRLSIGVQSFDDDDLKFLTRIHDAHAVRDTVHFARAAGFDNISIDLIFNLPGQIKEKWKHNLETALELRPEHISAYSLILEHGTILNKMVLDGKVSIADADYDAELYELTVDVLCKAGYTQYEVSNFALPGRQCAHNNHYWHYDDYIGLGTSAHSFVNGKRWWNFSGLNFYLRAIAGNGHAACGSEELTGEQMKTEFVMLAMRAGGLSEKKYSSYFNEPLPPRVPAFFHIMCQAGFIAYENGTWMLTPKGYALCDEILAKI